MAKQITTIKKIAVLDKRELRYAEMKGEEKFDIREWKSDTDYEDGVRFTAEEIKELYVAIKENKSTVGDKKLNFYNGEYCLSLVHNGRTYIRPFATKTEMDKLIEILDSCECDLSKYKEVEVNKNDESIKKVGRPKKNKDNEKTEQTENAGTQKKTEDKIIQFPKPKPEIEKLVTNGNATYEQCEVKLNNERKIFTDNDSQYVIDGVLELCKVDADFRNNVMREDKSYKGAMEYMIEMAKQGYAYKVSGGAFMDRDMGLGFTIDYFNSKPKPKPEPKNTVPKKATTTKKGK